MNNSVPVKEGISRFNHNQLKTKPLKKSNHNKIKSLKQIQGKEI